MTVIKRNPGQLSRFNTMVDCAGCGKRTHQNVGGACVGLCLKCLREAEAENDHNDNHDKDHPVKGCKHCKVK